MLRWALVLQVKGGGLERVDLEIVRGTSVGDMARTIAVSLSVLQRCIAAVKRAWRVRCMLHLIRSQLQLA
jgi:hypothetical protein